MGRKSKPADVDENGQEIVYEWMDDEWKAFIEDLKAFAAEHGGEYKEVALSGKKINFLEMYKVVTAYGGYEKVTLDRKWKSLTATIESISPQASNASFIAKQTYYRYLRDYEIVKFHKLPLDNRDRYLQTNDELSKALEDDDDTPYLGRRELRRRVTKTSSVTPPPIQETQGRRRKSSVVSDQPTNKFVPPSYKAKAVNVAPQKQEAVVQREVKLVETEPLTTYMVYSPQNRLTLALASGLPNEIEWALSKLIQLSYTSTGNWNIFNVPNLIDTILDLVQPYMKELASWMSTAQDSNGEFGSEILPIHVHPYMLHVLYIFRNLSFLDHHKSLFYAHHQVRLLILLCCSLPPFTNFIELRVNAVDILENVAPTIHVNNQEDKTLKALYNMTFDDDKAILCSALRTISKMFTESNVAVLSKPPIDVIKRAIDLTLLRDDEILNAALDYIYELTKYQDVIPKVLGVLPKGANIVRLLLGFLTHGDESEKIVQLIKRLEKGPEVTLMPRQAVQKMPVAPSVQAPAPQAAPAKPASPVKTEKQPSMQTPEHFRAFQWLRNDFYYNDRNAKSASTPNLPSATPPLTSTDLYVAYNQHIMQTGEKPIHLDDLIQVLKWAFPDVRVESNADKKLLLWGLKKGAKETESKDGNEVEDEDVDMDDENTEEKSQDQEEEDVDMMDVDDDNEDEKKKSGDVVSPSNTSVTTTTAATGSATSPSKKVVSPLNVATAVANKPSGPACHWQGCSMHFKTATELTDHVMQTHVPETTGCHWASCKRFADGTKPVNKDIITKHVLTHVATIQTSNNSLPTTHPTQPQRPPFLRDESAELCGIPLTAALILRNLVRNSQYHHFFMPYETQLVALIGHPRLGKILAGVLADVRT